MNNLIDFFLEPYYQKPIIDTILEATVFLFGIISVYYAKKESIWVYPTGLIATTISIYLLYKAEYFGDMTMNFYYSIMSVYGWWMWSRKKDGESSLKISRTNCKEKIIGFVLFLLTIGITYCIYLWFDYDIEWVNYIDIFTSGIFFTGMWYMAIKKIENWTLWIFADFITIPLYAYRGLGMLSLQYLIFTILAIQAYIAWKKQLENT